MLADQPTADDCVERVGLRDRHAGGDGEPRVAIQNILFPVTLDTTRSQLALVARVGDLLSQASRSSRSARRPRRQGGPAGIRHGDPAQLLRSLLHEWAEMGAPQRSRAARRLARRARAPLGRARRRSPLPSEAETLLRSLDAVDPASPAPLGRAVPLRLPLTEIGHRFGR